MAKGKRPRRFWIYIFRFIIILFLSSTAYALLCKWVFPPVTITQIASLVTGYGLDRDYVSWSEISPNVKLAAMASEDQLFAEHSGFDWNAIEKSMDGKRAGRKHKRASGAAASTISQQVAKNVFLWQGSGAWRYLRKAPEFYFTKIIEWTWGKQRILEVYLNVIEMGPGVFGIEAASQRYFHKHARALSRAEAAMIIACLPNPKKFTVKPQSRWVRWRYPRIMEQMNNLEGYPGIDALTR
ncbi:MAG: monofunctional biosynthetic peptidoglycan transglycosylase [Taibaiella sp.]|nr:monofunctional biosynthetic peptidoglycan transglycosylase [Taibaiella sp.]